MSNRFYLKGFDNMMKGNIDLISMDVKWVGVDTGAYTVNLSTHEFLSDIGAGARIFISPALASKSVSGGVFDAADRTFSQSGLSATSVEAMVLVCGDTSTPASCYLIGYEDNVSGITYTPNPSGPDVTIHHDDGSNKIFRLQQATA